MKFKTLPFKFRFCRIVFLLLALALLVSTSEKCFAQPVTWTSTDLGTPPAGSFVYAAGTPPTFTINGGGVGFGSNGLNFTWTNAVGNSEIETRVASRSTSTQTASGILVLDQISNNPAGNSAYFGIAVNASNQIWVQYRVAGGGGDITSVGGPTIATPVYLKITKYGTTLTGYCSSDGINWTNVASWTWTMPGSYYAGFWTDSGVFGTTLNTAVYDHVTFSTNVPQPASNLALWLRSDWGVTSSSGAVSAWTDQSGNGLNATQTTGTLQPTYTTGAVNSGVLPAITFNGTSQYFSLPTGLNTFASGASVFVVTKPQSTTATGDFCAFGNTSNADALISQAIGTQASVSTHNGSTNTTLTTTTNPLSTSNYQLIEEVVQPGNIPATGTGTIYVNGVQQAQSTTLQNLNSLSRSQNFIGTGIGLSNYFQGGIAEILVYNTPLNTAQRKCVENYIYGKYAVGTEPTLDPALMTPGPGVWPSAQTVTLTSPENGLVYYSLDGSIPSPTTSPYFVNPILVSANETINTIVAAPYFNNSAVSGGYYQFDPSTSGVQRNNLALWLKADTGITYNGSNQISQWNDLSGSQNNATQGTTANQPIFTPNIINGFPAATFNGSSAYLQFNQTLQDFSPGASVFAVVKPTAVAANATLIDLENNAPGTNVSLKEPSSTATTLNVFNSGLTSTLTASNAVTLNQFQMLENILGQPASAIYKNSILKLNNPLAAGNNYLGRATAGSNYFNGLLAELLVYNAPLSATDRANLEGYLGSKYNIISIVTNTLPPPLISTATATLTAPIQVAIAAPSWVVVHFTVDGTTPTSSSPTYTGPISIYYTQTLKAVSVFSGLTSAAASATYTLSDTTKWPAPNASDTTPLTINLQLPTTTIP